MTPAEEIERVRRVVAESDGSARTLPVPLVVGLATACLALALLRADLTSAGVTLTLVAWVMLGVGVVRAVRLRRTRARHAEWVTQTARPALFGAVSLASIVVLFLSVFSLATVALGCAQFLAWHLWGAPRVLRARHDAATRRPDASLATPAPAPVSVPDEAAESTVTADFTVPGATTLGALLNLAPASRFVPLDRVAVLVDGDRAAMGSAARSLHVAGAAEFIALTLPVPRTLKVWVRFTPEGRRLWREYAAVATTPNDA